MGPSIECLGLGDQFQWYQCLLYPLLSLKGGVIICIVGSAGSLELWSDSDLIRVDPFQYTMTVCSMAEQTRQTS